MILHRRVENLFNMAGKAMYLVDKEDIMLLQICKQGRKIPLPFNGGRRGLAEIRTHLICNDCGKRCFAKSGRSIEQDMIQGIMP